MGGVAHRIPGYGGYSRRESLREDDRVIREYVSDRLVSKRHAINIKIRDAEIAHAGELKRIADEMLVLEEEIRFSPYGYSPLFSDKKIRETDLIKIREVDAEMIEILETDGENLINKLRKILQRRKGIIKSIGV